LFPAIYFISVRLLFQWEKSSKKQVISEKTTFNKKNRPTELHGKLFAV